MMINFDSLTKLNRDGAEAALKSFSVLSTGAQTVTSESVDYVKRSFEASQKAAEQLFGAKTLDVALQIQGDYLRSSYEGFVAQTAKMGQLAVSVAKDAAAPLESLVKPTVN